MDKRIVEWNPDNSKQYHLYTNDKLELFQIFEENSCRSSNSVQQRKLKEPNLTCIQWNLRSSILQRSNLVTYGNSQGSVLIYDWITDEEIIINPQNRRNCNGLSWCCNSPNWLAAGFEFGRNECSGIIWDIERAGSNSASNHVLHSFGFGESITSICWLSSEDNVVVMGSGRGYIRLYDTRTAKASDLSFRVCEEDKVCKVKGIRGDPFNSSSFAVYSDAIDDGVKLLDVRLFDNSSTKPKFITLSVLPQTKSNTAVLDLAWSPIRPNTLAVLINEETRIPIYNTIKHVGDNSCIRSPWYSLSIPEPAKSMSWTHPRLLVATPSGVLDINVRERLPLSYCPVAAFNDLTSQGFLNENFPVRNIPESHVKKSKAINSSLDILKRYSKTPPDIEEYDVNRNIPRIIRKRALAGYNVNPGRNMQVFSVELGTIYNNRSRTLAAKLQKRKYSMELYKVWEWMNRMVIEDKGMVNISKCGAFHLFNNFSSSPSDIIYRHDTFGVNIYASDARSDTLESCGWKSIIGLSKPNNRPTRDTKKKEEIEERDADNKDILDALVSYICEDESYERAVALALWHGDIELAVETLRSFTDLIKGKKVRSNSETGTISTRGSESISSTISHQSEDEDVSVKLEDASGWDEPLTEQYLNVVSIMTACIAGYHNLNSKHDMWKSMCEEVINSLESYPRLASKYLIAACKFLLATMESPPDYSWILDQQSLYFEDRVAFACTYLTVDRVEGWLKESLAMSIAKGSLHGLLLTGLTTDGLSILQSYLDASGDIQTCALITSYLATSMTDKNVAPPLVAKEWLYEYRNLLNKWQMFFERCNLDVEIGMIQRKRDKLLGKMSSKSPNSNEKNTSNRSNPLKPLGKSNYHSKAVSENESSTKVGRQYFPFPVHNSRANLLIRCQVSYN